MTQLDISALIAPSVELTLYKFNYLFTFPIFLINVNQCINFCIYLRDYLGILLTLHFKNTYSFTSTYLYFPLNVYYEHLI